MSEHREAMNEIHLSVALSKLANLPMFTQKNGLSLMSSLEGMLLEPMQGGEAARHSIFYSGASKQMATA